MTFNSLPFLVFIVLFLPSYFMLRGSARLALILGGSYLFYGWWDWRFLGLIILSTAVDYIVGLRLGATDDEGLRRRLVAASIAVNLGILGLFKYFGFFVSSLQGLLGGMGIETARLSLNIVLPVGISFYTFQTMSYSLDLYRRKIPVEHNLLRFATYVAFFPQLVAGPIVRAAHFLPQLQSDRRFSWTRMYSGSGLILLGYFKKVVVADSLAVVIDLIFAHPESYSSLNLMIAPVLYAFQIYCDFSGYSDIAIGIARILGFDFPRNFNLPYFSRSFSEFWQRWHISLSSWLRDYLYISLGGNRHGRVRTVRNLMITMLLGGLWHGAGWNFIIWGGLHGVYLVGQRIFSGPFAMLMKFARVPRILQDSGKILIVFSLTCLSWIFFRSESVGAAITYLQGIGTLDSFALGQLQHKFDLLKGIFLIGVLLGGEVLSLRLNLNELVVERPVWRLAAFTGLLALIALFGTFGSNQFIYFQF